jgi:hypothetical protein
LDFSLVGWLLKAVEKYKDLKNKLLDDELENESDDILEDEFNEESSNVNSYTLIPPNKEIAISLKELFKDKIKAEYGFTQLRNCVNSLATGDIVNFQIKINEIISPVISVKDWHEYFYHGLVIGMVLFMADRFDIKSQRESGEGYPDLILVPKGMKNHNGLVIEFKKVPDPSINEEVLKGQVHTQLKNAFNQITNLKYQTILKEEKNVKDILKYAIVFSKKTCYSLLQVNNESILKNGDGSIITFDELVKS